MSEKLRAIPELEHYCNSWIVTRKVSGEVIGEFYNRVSLDRFNPEKVLIQTAAQYLATYNRLGINSGVAFAPG